MTEPLRYSSAGVDLSASDSAKARIGSLVEATFTGGALGKFGGFGGMFRMPADIADPVLVASADGVGTKIKVAIEAGRHGTIGRDLVNHCANDILVQGARPLFFLDYLAFGKLVPETVEQVVAGIAAGCLENGCSLIGGETAEMPDLYQPPDYDLAGFIVGCVAAEGILGPDRVREGDSLIGLASSGLHTNGYSLARMIVTDRMRLGHEDTFPGTDRSVADVLLDVHRSYVGALTPVLAHVHAMAHITGGGVSGNLNRALPAGLDAVVSRGAWQVPHTFRVLQDAGDVQEDDMFAAFNMGIGMIVATAADFVGDVVASARAEGVDCWTIGEIRRGSGRVILS